MSEWVRKWVSEWVSEWVHGTRLEIERVINFGPAKILRKIVKPKYRCDVHFKKGGKGRKGQHMLYLTKVLTECQSGDWSSKYRKTGDVCLVFSYRCKAPRAICTQSKRSTLVATNNGSCTRCTPAYIDQICENICWSTNKQSIHRHNMNSCCNVR